MMLLFSSIQSLRSFRHEYKACTHLFNTIDLIPFRILHQIYAVNKVAIKETMWFVQESLHTVFEMVRSFWFSFVHKVETYYDPRRFRAALILPRKRSYIYYI